MDAGSRSTGAHEAVWRASLAYAALALLSAALGLAVRGRELGTLSSPWLDLSTSPFGVHGASLAFGVVTGGALVAVTRVLHGRFAWARRLSRDLQPLTRGLGGWHVVALAVLSSLGEELVFRALLQPWLGLVLTSALFGLAHQMRGPSRWYWVGWAALAGLVLGALFEATGSLAGPLAAHAIVNGLNLERLRHEPAEPDLSVKAARA
jgi:membrane protease YdiL (CAAX protease family)